MKRETYVDGPLTDDELNPPADLDRVCRRLADIDGTLNAIATQLRESDSTLAGIKDRLTSGTVETGNLAGYLLVIIALLILHVWRQW